MTKTIQRKARVITERSVSSEMPATLKRGEVKSVNDAADAFLRRRGLLRTQASRRAGW